MKRLQLLAKELVTAIRRLSKYLKEKYPDIHSAEELDRELLEEYLTYLATEAEGVTITVWTSCTRPQHIGNHREATPYPHWKVYS